MTILIIFFTAGCAEFSKTKVDNDGYYRFKKLPIDKTVKVRAPKECILDMFVYETSENTVDFVTGRGYWTASGQYAVQIWERNSEITSDEVFYKGVEKHLKHYLETDRKTAGFNFHFIRSEVTKINDRPAIKGIAVENGKAIFVTTIVLFDDSLAYLSLLYPLKTRAFDETRNDANEAEVPWDCYNRFVNSMDIS